ncbi:MULTISPECIES: hypothetical protein [unclassified Methylobacterium]|uniref:hypothetical protein n=1 Tax=unclassified Methylobacterium TaxID=2615210 RepID=UPI0011C1F172|nr:MULTISPECIES: hypothetical protein [unclassified Methylobacterium]QEE38622.1 hypothetical protein FVA80_06155 [Methylobacterium sp. WL1]TXN03929.1 hypothetical protein FV242_09415 [Methylobacterium sp. WL64]TXN57942.1 hypothetical protein FV241_09055 [Methylobacterium sp. WL2]
MTVIRLVAAGLAVSLSLGSARAVDRDLTGSIARPDAGEPAQDIVVAAPDERTTVVVLPQQSVTTSAPLQRVLPPLKPLPKWDPRVCIGC